MSRYEGTWRIKIESLKLEFLFDGSEREAEAECRRKSALYEATATKERVLDHEEG